MIMPRRSPKPPRILLFAAVLICASLLAAACGGDENGSDGAPTTEVSYFNQPQVPVYPLRFDGEADATRFVEGAYNLYREIIGEVGVPIESSDGGTEEGQFRSMPAISTRDLRRQLDDYACTPRPTDDDRNELLLKLEEIEDRQHPAEFRRTAFLMAMSFLLEYERLIEPPEDSEEAETEPIREFRDLCNK